VSSDKKRAIYRRMSAATTACSGRLPLRHPAVVVLQEAAQASAAANIGQRDRVGLPLSFQAMRRQKLVTQTLVRSLSVVPL
jgi:hypothetical protein